jgi:hypothetical protein
MGNFSFVNAMNRRQLVRLGAAASSTWMLPRSSSILTAAEIEDPHFYVHIVIPGGWDPTYLFDARPLEFTKAGKLQNFIGKEPEPFFGKNGGTALRTEVSRAFDRFLPEFSIVNGIHMATDFDGHEQGINFIMSGNPFGGDSFMPFLNSGSTRQPLDYIRTGRGNFLVNLTNTGDSALLSVSALKNLLTKLQGQHKASGAARMEAYIEDRFNVAARLPSKIGAAAQKMLGAHGQSQQVFGAFKKMDFKVEQPVGEEPGGPGEAKDDPTDKSADLIIAFLKERIARAGLFIFNTDLNPNLNLDAHDNDSAKQLPEALTTVFSELTIFLQRFKDTPFDRTRSMFDVTTFMVCSEMSRTMRQSGPDDLEKGGTDHNSLTNMAILGGKGIRPAQIIGASDFQTLADMEKPSGAHLYRDRRSDHIMGKPFDFASEMPRNDLPEAYKVSDYLTFNSITNTLMSLFGIKEDKWFAAERNGPKAPIIKSLLG